MVSSILTGLPVLYIAIYSPTLLPWGEIDVPILPYTHLLGILCPWVGSFIYHTFMNHTAGCGVYRRLLQLDMLGIWVTQSLGNSLIAPKRSIVLRQVRCIAGALTTVYAAVYCLSKSIRLLITALYAITCLWGLYKVRHRFNIHRFLWPRHWLVILLTLTRRFIYSVCALRLSWPAPTARLGIGGSASSCPSSFVCAWLACALADLLPVIRLHFLTFGSR